LTDFAEKRAAHLGLARGEQVVDRFVVLVDTGVLR